MKRLSRATARACGHVRQRAFSRGVSTVLALAVLPLAAAGCGGGVKGQSDPDSATLKIAVNSEVSGNPAKAEYSVYWGAVGRDPAYAALLHMSPDGTVEPYLATKWGYVDSDKGRNRVFDLTLREDAKFSDGTPVDAKAVAASMAYFVEAKGIYSGVLGPDPKITATGPYTVRIEMRQPNPSLPVILSDQGSVIGQIMSPKAVAEPKLMNSGTYGAGPYKLLASETVTGDHYTYVPNPHFFDQEKIRFEKIYLKVIASPASRLRAHLSGEYDVTIGEPSTLAEAKAAGLQVATAPQGIFRYTVDMIHDVGAPALKDVKVRRAMSYAIDRAKIAQALFAGAADPRFGPVTMDVATDPCNVKYPYNPAKAKQLMQEAGYSDGFTLSMIDTGNSFGKSGTDMTGAVAEYWKAIGITVQSRSLPNLTAYANEFFKYKTAISQSLATIATTPQLYTQNMDPKDSAINVFGDDPQMVDAYNEAVSSDDPAEGWCDMWKRYTDQQYVIPMVTYPAIYYSSKGIGGVKASAKHPSALPTEWYPTDGAER